MNGRRRRLAARSPTWHPESVPSRAARVVVDAADPQTLARFWSDALDWAITSEESGVVEITPPLADRSQAGQLPLAFVPTSEPKSVKNRIHLDLASRSKEHQAALVEQLETLGAGQIDLGQRDVTWVVMADPEGNEFCVVSHRGSVGKDPASAFGNLSPVAAIVFDCADPQSIAPFWARATGWPALGEDDQGVWLRDVSTNGPYLDLHRVTEQKSAPLRVRLEIESPDDVPDGTADPEGNEFTVVTRR